MKTKIISVILAVIICIPFISLAVSAAAETTAQSGEGEFRLTVDVNKRETNIVEDENGILGLITDDSEKQQKEANKKIYIAVLSVLLVIAVIVLVVSLRRVPDEEDIELDDDSADAEKKE